MSNNSNNNIDAKLAANAARFDTLKKALRFEVCKEAYGTTFDANLAARISSLQGELRTVVLAEAALRYELAEAMMMMMMMIVINFVMLLLSLLYHISRLLILLLVAVGRAHQV